MRREANSSECTPETERGSENILSPTFNIEVISGKENLEEKWQKQDYLSTTSRLQKERFKLFLWNKYNIYVKSQQMLLQEENKVGYDITVNGKNKYNIGKQSSKAFHNNKYIKPIAAHCKNAAVKLLV